DPTEGALTVLSAKTGLTKESLHGLYEREREFPFDSERKRMSVIVKHQGGRLLATKGAPDVLLQPCDYILWDGKIKVLDDSLRAKVREANDQMARSALRVLGLAYRDLANNTTEIDKHGSADEFETKLIFVGLAGMIDPPREEVKEAIYKCRNAGIRTIMITGDHQTTAEAIARQLNMLPKGGQTVN